MLLQSETAENLDAAGLRAKYDRCVKVLLANKPLLAWILKGCAREFIPYDIGTIMDCIEGTPDIGSRAVHRNAHDRIVEGINTEDANLTEQTICYDILFHAVTPDKTGKQVRLFVNIEAQNDSSLGYPIEKRMEYYLARLISRQYGTVFTHSHYEKIEKVYSIWILTNPKSSEKNTIRRFALGGSYLFGNGPGNFESDMEGILISLSTGDHATQNELIRLLSVLLSADVDTAEKKRMLQEEYKIPMTEEIEGEVNGMCNLSQGIWDNGVEKGRQEGIEEGKKEGIQEGMKEGCVQTLLSNLKNLIKNAGISASQAMDLLAVAPEERNKYAVMLEEADHK